MTLAICSQPKNLRRGSATTSHSSTTKDQPGLEGTIKDEDDAMTRITTLTRNALLATVFAALALSAATMVIGERESDATSTKNEGEKSQSVAAQSEATQAHHHTTGAAIKYANVGTFRNQVLQSRLPVLVDFYADWCGPCQIQDGVLKEFAAEFAGGKIVKVNVDESPELAGRYDVRGLPTLLIFQDGQVIARQVGLATKEQLRTALAG